MALATAEFELKDIEMGERYRESINNASFVHAKMKTGTRVSGGGQRAGVVKEVGLGLGKDLEELGLGRGVGGPGGGEGTHTMHARSRMTLTLGSL